MEFHYDTTGFKPLSITIENEEEALDLREIMNYVTTNKKGRVFHLAYNIANELYKAVPKK